MTISLALSGPAHASGIIINHHIVSSDRVEWTPAILDVHRGGERREVVQHVWRLETIQPFKMIRLVYDRNERHSYASCVAEFNTQPAAQANAHPLALPYLLRKLLI